MKYIFIPYMLRDGIPTFRDSELKGLYEQLVKEETADTVFYDDTVNSANDFLDFMKYRGNSLYVVYKPKDNTPIGFFWINGFERTFCRLHFAVFKHFWGKDTVGVGKQTVKMILSLKDEQGEYLWDVILGILPSWNKFAIEYIKLVGCKVVGEIPHLTHSKRKGKSVPGTLIYITRKEISNG